MFCVRFIFLLVLFCTLLFLITNATRVVVALLFAEDSRDRFYVAFLDFSVGLVVFFEKKKHQRRSFARRAWQSELQKQTPDDDDDDDGDDVKRCRGPAAERKHPGDFRKQIGDEETNSDGDEG
jgi:hypothetical protein